MSAFPTQAAVSASVTEEPGRRDFLVARATLTNVGRETLRLVLETCPLTILAYRVQNAAPAAVWRSDRAPRMCKDIRLPLALAPGAQHVLVTRFTKAALLGDSLSTGRYRFAAVIRTAEPAAVSPEVSAGELDVRP